MLEKVLKIIDSCETIPQLHIALKVAKLAILQDHTIASELLVAIADAEIKIIISFYKNT